MSRFRSCSCEKTDDPSIENLWAAPEGTFAWGWEEQKDGSKVRTIRIVVPYDTLPSYHILKVYQVPPDKLKEAPQPPEVPSPAWAWDGNVDKPSLHPSIACGPRKKRDWHGYLKNGVLEACE